LRPSPADSRLSFVRREKRETQKREKMKEEERIRAGEVFGELFCGTPGRRGERK